MTTSIRITVNNDPRVSLQRRSTPHAAACLIYNHVRDGRATVFGAPGLHLIRSRGPAMPETGTHTDFDAPKAEAFASRLLTALNNGAFCLMASIGHRTG